MKLVTQTPERLVLLHRPLLLCAALGAGTLLLVGAGLWNATQGDWIKAGVALLSACALMVPALWFAAERVDVTFDAASARCTVTTRRLSGPVEEAYPLDSIDKAMVQTHKGPGDAAGAHRVALVLHPGRAEDRRPLTTGYASGRGAAEIAARINSWLAARAGNGPA